MTDRQTDRHLTIGYTTLKQLQNLYIAGSLYKRRRFTGDTTTEAATTTTPLETTTTVNPTTTTEQPTTTTQQPTTTTEMITTTLATTTVTTSQPTTTLLTTTTPGMTLCTIRCDDKLHALRRHGTSFSPCVAEFFTRLVCDVAVSSATRRCTVRRPPRHSALPANVKHGEM